MRVRVNRNFYLLSTSPILKVMLTVHMYITSHVIISSTGVRRIYSHEKYQDNTRRKILFIFYLKKRNVCFHLSKFYELFAICHISHAFILLSRFKIFIAPFDRASVSESASSKVEFLRLTLTVVQLSSLFSPEKDHEKKWKRWNCRYG